MYLVEEVREMQLLKDCVSHYTENMNGDKYDKDNDTDKWIKL